MIPTATVNKQTVVHKDSDGKVVSSPPDVCLTPPGVAVSYVNVAFSRDLADGSVSVFVDDDSIALKDSIFATSYGDEPGTMGGVVSGVNKGIAKFTTYSMDVKVEGRNVARRHDWMSMNGNTPNVSKGKEKQGNQEKKPCIDWESIKGKEGGRRTDGYVPANLNPKTGLFKRIRYSGITIASGVDLNYQDPSTLGLSADLAKKLQPYYNLSADDVNDYVNAHPDAGQQTKLDKWMAKNKKTAPPDASSDLDKLDITDDEAKQIDQKVKEKFEKNLAKAYDTKDKKFVDLPCAAQTALMSAYYNSPGKASTLFKDVRNGDYDKARDSLYDSSDMPHTDENKGILNRRYADGALFNKALPAAQQQTFAQWSAAQKAAAAAAKAGK